MPEPLRNTFYTTYPGKAFFTLLTLTINAIRLPFWIIYFIPPFLRQNPKWSWRQALRVRIVRAFLTWASAVEMLTPFNLKPSREKDQFVTIPPADSKYFTGVTTSDPSIKPATIGCTWYPGVPKQGEKIKKMIIHFHGGAYVIGDGRKEDCGHLANTYLANSGVSYVACIQYRLASNDGGRFPAALQDAVTALTHVLGTIKVDPREVIVGGDSAGANLTLALLRYIKEHGGAVGLPNPRAALLWSPWVDPQGSTDIVRFLSAPNEPTDYISPGFGCWGAKCYMPLKQSSVTDEYIDFKGHQFTTPVPLYFSIGESEILHPDAVETSEKFETAGNKVEVSIEPYAPHDILLVGDKTSFEVEAAAAAKKAGRFLNKVFQN